MKISGLWHLAVMESKPPAGLWLLAFFQREVINELK
jgi:hypothetical protein